MKIHVHIERLILDGLPLEKGQGPEIQAAVERELTRLLTAGGLGGQWQSGAAVPRIRASGMQLANVIRPNRLGEQIGQSVYSGIGRPR